MHQFRERMSISRRGFLFSAASVLARTRLFAADEDAKFSSDVNVVNIFATVNDKKGHVVSNLNRDDFVLQEDGRPQAIRYFARESDLPLTLGLLVDTSLSQRRVLGAERTASYVFFEKVLREDKDHAFVIHFDREVELLQDLTSSRQKLEKALQLLDVAEPEGQGRWQRQGPGRHAGTTLYDAILLASDELMKKQQGRKALILLTDGVDRGSKTSLTDSIQSAQRADTLVYSILFADNDFQQGYRPGGYGGRHGGGWGGGGGGWGGGRRGGYGGERPDGKKVLQRISSETGGTFYEVSHK